MIIIVVLVSKVDSYVGDSVNISWTASFFPRAGSYNVYYTDNVIIEIYQNRATLSRSKYQYVSRPYNSTNITFEIRDVTRDDAGYYNGGVFPAAAWSGGGVVLIVHSKYIYICGFKGRRKSVMIVATTPLNLRIINKNVKR